MKHTVHKNKVKLKRLYVIFSINVPPGDGVGWELVVGGALEAHHVGGLVLAVGHAVGVVAEVVVGRIRQPLLAGGLIRNAGRALNQ